MHLLFICFSNIFSCVIYLLFIEYSHLVYLIYDLHEEGSSVITTKLVNYELSQL